MAYRQHPFTPQRSPSRPGSKAASPAHSSAGDAPSQNPREQARQEVRPETDTATGPSSKNAIRSPSSSSLSIDTSFALRGWTAHQSHGQATILFYVPRWTRSEEIDVTIQQDFIVAGIKGKAPIVMARLSGRIDPARSSWQLERKRSSKRHRSHSRSRNRTKTRTRTSSLEHSSSSGGAEASIGEGKARGETLTVQQTVPPRNVRRSASTSIVNTAGSHTSSPPVSPVQSDASSFDLLQQSSDTLANRASSQSLRSPTNARSSPFDQRSISLPQDADEAHSPSASSPTSLSQSALLSDGTGDYVHWIVGERDSSESGGVRSMESSMSVAQSHASWSGTSRRRTEEDEAGEDDDPIRDARLVTLHLDKIDGGIWPCIVSGPAPTARHARAEAQSAHATTSQLFTASSQVSLTAALSEALHQHHRRSIHAQFDEDRREDNVSLSDQDSDGHRAGPQLVNESTTTIDSIASDDSTTVLGLAREQQRDKSEDEDRYNMDPISLTLLGLQHVRRSGHNSAGVGGKRDERFAFECLRRAWKNAEIPVAIECLVHDYLPLRHATSSAASPQRQRLIASLGGMSALARLYVSFAHLYMPTYEGRKPLLSLPMSGSSNNPFGGAQSTSTSQQYLHRSSTTLSAAGPLEYLQEARRLDASIDIADSDWQEAHEIEQILHEAAATRSWSGATSPTSRSDGYILEGDAGQASRGVGSAARTSRRRQNDSHRNGKRRRHRNGYGDKYGAEPGSSSSAGAADQGLLFLVVSRAALLSVMVAGGVAVAGWWRRASAAGGSV